MRLLFMVLAAAVGCFGIATVSYSGPCYIWPEVDNCNNYSSDCPFVCEPVQAPMTACGVKYVGNDFSVYSPMLWVNGEGTAQHGGTLTTNNCVSMFVCYSSDVVIGGDEGNGLQFCFVLPGFSYPFPLTTEIPGSSCPVLDGA